MVVMSSCELPHQPGPMPKDIIDLKLDAGLNILGIIRLNGNNPESFIYVEEALKTKDYYGNDPAKTLSDVLVFVSDNDSLYNFNIYDEIDTTRYLNPSFIPKEKETYNLEINATGKYGDVHLTAKTVVPSIPTLDTNSISLLQKTMTFDIFTTDDAFRYDVVLFFEQVDLRQSIFVNENGTQNIEFKYSEDLDEPLFIGIAAYDENLTEYLNATSSIIPQTYQEDISTVEQGYGCFGAISIQSFEIK